MLRHRGPDGARVWTSPSQLLSLAHARLATIDLLNGQQPISSEDQSIVAVINGEFYETQQIRLRLEGLGHRFKTRTDSECLIHLYEQCGVACLSQLQGEFAFVLWDENKRLLFAARDRFGVKPLYYSERNGELLMASEVKALHAAGFGLSWDEQGFEEQFVFQCCLQGRTLYQGVRELPAGHYLLRAGNSSEIRRYWDLDYELVNTPMRDQSDDEWASQLLESLESAVACRMQADVPVACYLSGGIDSNSILALMSRHTPGLTAFCASFDTAALDEFDIAARSAASMGVSLIKVPVSSKTIAADFKSTIWHCENLIGNANSVAKFALSRAASEAGFRVVLSGEGADELFAGYPNLVADSLRGMSSQEKEQLQRALGVSAEKLESILNPMARPLSVPLRDRLGYSPIWLEVRHWVMEQFKTVLPHACPGAEMDTRLLDSLDVAGRLRGRSILSQSCYIHSKTCFAGVTLSSLGDRVEMAHSIESRLPFLDGRVVDFARRVPASQKVRNGAEKFVLRKAMRSLVPAEICGRRKQPILAPPALWDRSSPFGQLLQDTLRSRYLHTIPSINGKELVRILDDMENQPTEVRRPMEAPMLAFASACVLAETLAIS